MAWRDELRPGSFRGVPFYVRRARTQHVRLADEHVFPGRIEAPEAVQVAHIGQGPQRFALEAVVSGDDYLAFRDQLVIALRTPGPGILVHPYYGRRTVEIVGGFQVTESKERHGQAAFTFTAVEVVEQPGLLAEADLEAEAFGALDRTIEALAAQFEADYVADLDAVPAIATTASVETFDAALDDLGAAHGALAQRLRVVDDYAVRVRQLSTRLEAFATTPLVAALAAQGAIQATVALPLEVANAALANEGIGEVAFGALDALEGLFAFGRTAPVLDVSTQSGLDARRLRDAVHALIRGSALAEGARMLVALPYSSRRAALAARARYLEALDLFEAEGPAAGTSAEAANLFQALRGARSAFAAAMEAVESTLPEVRDVTLDEPVPAVVLAHELYGDATREAEIVARLRPAFPSRLPAGEPLEVLRA